MRNCYISFALTLCMCLPGLAQTPTPPPPSVGTVTSGGMVGSGRRVLIHREMGKWWQNSEIAKKLQLSDSQIAQLDQTFYDHRLKLIDYGAEMEKEDLKLQTLLDADVPNEGQISGQVDQVLAARGKLEREFTMMNLDLRKVLSVEQWRQLKSIHAQHHPEGDVFFYRKIGPGAGTMGPETMPLPPLPPGDPMF